MASAPLRSRSARTPTPMPSASRRSSTPLPAEQRCGSMPIAHTWRPTPAALPHPSIPPASSCSNSHAIPTIGTRTPVSRKYPPFPLCWMSRSAGSKISNAPPKFRMLDSASSKLKRFGSLDALKQALERVRELGMEPVLGDGISSELQCWMEGCIARHVIRNAGEFNGFLKPKARLFAEPLRFAAGELVLAAGYTPTIDAEVLAAHELARERFVAAKH